MNEIRKVLGELIVDLDDIVEIESNEDALSECRSVAGIIKHKVQSLLQSLPADGGAWYPTYDDVARRIGVTFLPEASNAQIIRAAIDEYRSRGGLAGGEVDHEALTDMLADARNELDMTRAALGIEYEPHQSLHERTLERARELIARQPAAQDTPEIPEGALCAPPSPGDRTQGIVRKPAHGPVVAEPVAWRWQFGTNSMRSWHDGQPSADVLREHEENAASGLYGIELAYSHPATVPAEVMEAAKFLADPMVNPSEDWLDRAEESGRSVVAFLKSIGA